MLPRNRGLFARPGAQVLSSGFRNRKCINNNNNSNNSNNSNNINNINNSNNNNNNNNKTTIYKAQ